MSSTRGRRGQNQDQDQLPDLDALVRRAEAEIERLKAEGPTESEVIKAQNNRESLTVVDLEAMEDRAEFLNRYNVEFGDPMAYRDEMRRLFQVTADDVKRVANHYLTSGRVRINVIPGAKSARPEPKAEPSAVAPSAALPEHRPIVDTFDRSLMSEVGPAPKFSPPPVVRRRLSNGLEVLIAERHGLPILSLDLVVRGGETLVTAEKGGLASLTAEMLTEGTTSRDALKLAGALSEIGTSIAASGRREWSSLALTTLTRHTAKALELYTDVLLNPAFSARELARLQTQRAAELKARWDDPESVAGVVFPRLLYGAEHPYGRPDLGTPESVAGLKPDDLAAFYQRLYRPDNASLIVSGDTTPEAITNALEAALGGWKPAPGAARRRRPSSPSRPGPRR